MKRRLPKRIIQQKKAYRNGFIFFQQMVQQAQTQLKQAQVAPIRPKPTDDVICQVPKCIRVHGAYRMPMLTPDCVLLRGGLALRRGGCLRLTRVCIIPREYPKSDSDEL